MAHIVVVALVKLTGVTALCDKSFVRQNTGYRINIHNVHQ